MRHKSKERTVHQQYRPLSFGIPLLSSVLLFQLLGLGLLLFLLLLEGRKVNHLGGIVSEVGQLLVLGELLLEPIQHELVGAGLLLGTLLNHLKLGQQLVGVLKHAHVLLHVLVGQVLGGTGLLGGAAGLADNGQAGEVGAELQKQLVFLGGGIVKGFLESLAHGEGVVYKINLVSVVLHGNILLFSFYFSAQTLTGRSNPHHPAALP